MFSSISKTNWVADLPFFCTLIKSNFVIIEPSKKFADFLIPSIIFDLSAPRSTNDDNIISPEIPATWQSMKSTMSIR